MHKLVAELKQRSLIVRKLIAQLNNIQAIFNTNDHLGVSDTPNLLNKRYIGFQPLRQFAADDLDKALAWSAEPTSEAQHVEIMEGLPRDVVGVSVRGVVTAKDYQETIAPLVEKAHEEHGKIKLLYVAPERLANEKFRDRIDHLEI